MSDDAAGAGAMARPVSRPAATVAGQVGTSRLAISRMAQVAQLIAAMNGTSIGVKNRLP